MHIAILTWWTSSERTIALRSGANLNEWIEKAWHTTELFDFPTELDVFLTKYKTYDLVIPMFHGVYGEDGQVTAFLEILGCRYAYSDFHVHALCLDKNQTNLAIEQIGVKVPASIYVREWSEFDTSSLSYPRFIKPNKWWSSISNFLVHNSNESDHALDSIIWDDILIQSLISGREFTVWVYRDSSGTYVLPIIEIVTIEQEFFGYKEKYESDWSNEVFSELDSSLKQELEETSSRIYDHLGCRGVVRIDWRYDWQDIYFLEVNTIPGFTSGSLVPKMWKKAGKTEREFVEMLKF